MKKILLLIICLTPILAFADSPAIKKLNFRVSADYASSKLDNEDIGNNTSLSGEIRIPVVDYIGITLNAGLNKFKGKTNYIDSDSTSVGLGIIFRNTELGEINANHSEITTDFNSVLIDSLDSSITNLSGILYLNNFDISTSRSETKFKDLITFKSSTFSASYYFSDNFKFNALIGKVDDSINDKFYQYIAIYQPEFFENSLSISLSYYDYDIYKQTIASISYYFNNRVSLLKRDRKY